MVCLCSRNALDFWLPRSLFRFCRVNIFIRSLFIIVFIFFSWLTLGVLEIRSVPSDSTLAAGYLQNGLDDFGQFSLRHFILHHWRNVLFPTLVAYCFALTHFIFQIIINQTINFYHPYFISESSFFISYSSSAFNLPPHFYNNSIVLFTTSSESSFKPITSNPIKVASYSLMYLGPKKFNKLLTHSKPDILTSIFLSLRVVFRPASTCTKWGPALSATNILPNVSNDAFLTLNLLKPRFLPKDLIMLSECFPISCLRQEQSILIRLQELYIKWLVYYFDLIVAIKKAFGYCWGHFRHGFEKTIFVLGQFNKNGDNFESEIFTCFREGCFVDSLDERRNKYFICWFGIILSFLDKFFYYFKRDLSVGFYLVSDAPREEGC